MKPMIKYRGGKWKEISMFSSFIPDEFDTYIEPFFGGGATFFYLEPKRAIINDVNSRLIQFYQEIRDNFCEVRRQLDELQAIYDSNQKQYEQLKNTTPDERVENKNEALYYMLRDMFNGKVKSPYLEAVLYFFINKTAYSGMIRYNAQGEYNVPFGRYKNFNTQLITQEHSTLLQQAQIFASDYSEIFNMAKDTDFMFIDPPYDCIFNEYGNIEAKNGFDEEEHRRLAINFRQLSCKTLMIIGKTPLTKELYGQYVVGEYEKSYAVNIRNRFKSGGKHIIVTNYQT